MKPTILLLAMISASSSWAASQSQSAVFQLSDAEQVALQSDERLAAASSRLKSSQALVEAEGQLPDPRLRLALLNLPTDTFDFDQEPMTQAFAGLKQSFPAGSTLAIKELIAQSEVERRKATIETQRAIVLRELRQRWLNVYASEEELLQLQKEHKVLDAMIPSATGAYRAGKGTQTDVVKIKLKLALLNESIVILQGRQSENRAALGRWFSSVEKKIWPSKLPNSLMETPQLGVEQNPEITESTAMIETSKQKVELARQAYKPSWGVEASYGLRESRPDFLSLGVTVSLPVFASTRQDHRLNASQTNLVAAELDKKHLLAELRTKLSRMHASVDALDAQIGLYDEEILPELVRIQTLSKNDFRTGKATFSAVLEAQEAVLKSQRKQLLLTLERAQKIIDIRFITGESKAGETES